MNNNKKYVLREDELEKISAGFEQNVPNRDISLERKNINNDINSLCKTTSTVDPNEPHEELKDGTSYSGDGYVYIYGSGFGKE